MSNRRRGMRNTIARYQKKEKNEYDRQVRCTRHACTSAFGVFDRVWHVSDTNRRGCVPRGVRYTKVDTVRHRDRRQIYRW